MTDMLSRPQVKMVVSAVVGRGLWGSGTLDVKHVWVKGWRVLKLKESVSGAPSLATCLSLGSLIQDAYDTLNDLRVTRTLRL